MDQDQTEMEDDVAPVVIDRTKLTPTMRHYLQMSKMHSDNDYKSKDAKVQQTNELTKSFCEQEEYKINKNVHELTVDRNYGKGKAEAVETMKGHQNLGYDNPAMAYHAKNAEQLSDVFYKESYEQDKDIVYFPVDAAPVYQTSKRVKTATDDANYKAAYEEMKHTNKLNLCDTPVYKTHQEVQDKTCNKNYTKDHQATKHQVHPEAVTHDMIQSQKQQAVLTQKNYTKEGLAAIRSYNNDASMMNRGDIQQAQKTQKQDDHLKIEYKKDYEANKTKYEFEKALNDVPLIKQNILASKQADATGTTYGAGGKKAMERNEFTKTYCDTAVYKTNKAITNITRDSVYQAGKQEAIDKFKGFQAMDIQQIGEFKQHMMNSENLSETLYKEDYENEKDLVYFPQTVTSQYENQQKIHEKMVNYKKDATKEQERHHFNLADSETYRVTSDVVGATSNKKYTEKYNADKIKVKPAAKTQQMELNEKLKPIKDGAYTEQWNKDKTKINFPPDNPVMLNQKKAAKQASDLHYKKDYNENVLGAKSHMTADGDLEYVVVKGVKEITDSHNYTKDAQAQQSKHKYAPEFCNTETYKIAKNITEVTSDRYNTTKETLKNFQGWNQIRPEDNPSIIHHAKNADQLNPYLYKEDYEYDKLDCYYPQQATEQYLQTKKLKETVGDREYTAAYEKMKVSNHLNLADTETYKVAKDVDDNYRNPAGYKKKYETEIKGHCIGYTSTPEMETLKAVKPYQNDANYQKEARKLMAHNVLPDDTPEMELAKQRQVIRSDLHYKKDYEATKAKNIPGPIENYHDYKAQADVKAITNDAAYKADYQERVKTNSITKEYCNTEQYRCNQKIKEIQSNANYTDFPETRKKYQGFQSMEIHDVPDHKMHARNADQTSADLYKEDWNIDKELVFFPVQITEKFQQDKNLKETLDNYTEKYENDKSHINFDTTQTEKYVQDRKHAYSTSDASGYKEDWKKNVQGHQKGVARTMQMEVNDTLKIVKDANYTEGAKQRMKSVNRSLQDPDMAQMAKSQVMQSDLDYKKDYNENVLGHNIGAPLEGHLDYYSQKKVKDITADAAYTADAKERMKTFVLEPDAPFVRSAIDTQKMVNMATYRQSGKDAIKTHKGFQQLDIYSNPYLNRHIINSENLSDTMYKEAYEADKDCIYYPYNSSEKYTQDKKLHETVSDLYYGDDHQKNDWKHGFDLCATEQYGDAKKGDAIRGKHYKAKYLEDVYAGKAGGKLSHIWEMDAKNIMKPMRDHVYHKSAKEIQRKYHLMLDDVKLGNLMKVQKIQNDRLYKAKYNAETKGQTAADPGIAYPYLKQQSELGEKMRPSQYGADARVRMEKPQNWEFWDELKRSRDIALKAKDSEYRKSRDEAIKTFKGFQQLDIYKIPYMNRHIVNSENLSQWHYINDWEEEKDLVYYPAEQTPQFQDIKAAHDLKMGYEKESKKIQMHPHYNQVKTEQYTTDNALHKAMMPSNYGKEAKNDNATKTKPVAKTMEMERNAALKPFKPTNYAAEAKRLAMKYGLTADDNKLAASLLAGKITSDLLYRRQYEKEVKGKPVNNPAIAYEMSTERCKKASKQRSDWEYQKEGRATMEHNEYTKAQYTEATKSRLIALQCNDAEYTKGKREAIDEFKGFMRMNASEHPVVTRGVAISEILSNAFYKDDWEMEKDLIYYPVNITPGYESMKKAAEFQSDLHYKANHEDTKFKNKYFLTETQQYADQVKVRQVQSDKSYHAEWDKKGRHEFKLPKTTMEMERFSPLKKLSGQEYSKEAKKLAMKYGLTSDDNTLTHLMAIGGVCSALAYKKKYNKEDLGKSATADINGYLPYVAQKELREKTSDSNYKAVAKKILEKNLNQPCNEEIKARQVALKMNDSEYKKSMWEAISTMKGYMRMDAHLHPVVQRGVLVAEMQSNALYKEDWNMEKDAIYFPVQVTPGYETALRSYKQQSDLVYQQKYQANKFKHQYAHTESEVYKNQRNNEQFRSDKEYHRHHEETKHMSVGVAVTSEMERSVVQKNLRDAKYQKEAKILAMKYGLTHDDIKLANLLQVGAVCSDRLYKKHYNQNVLGQKSSADIEGYLPYVSQKEVHDKTVDYKYKKAAAKGNQKNLYVQWDEELRARRVALSVKDSAYKQSMLDAIRDCKGFMRMDAALHPVVQRGIHVAELVSDALYREDWNEEKDLIYFPVQVTPAYETAVEGQKNQSQTIYKAKYEETKHQNKYDATQDQRYEEIKVNEAARSDKTYRADYNKTKHQHTTIAVTMDMERARIQDSIKDTTYKKDAKRLAMKYGLVHDDLKLANCLAVAKRTSDLIYYKDYKENVLGASSKADVSGNPVYRDAQANHKITAAYSKKARAMLMKNNYAPFDEEKRATTVALYCNPDCYAKQRREVITAYKGYMRMDASLHPVVQRGILVAEMQSDALYREDYELEKDLIYFPAQITPGYEAAQQAYKFSSDHEYRKTYHKEKKEGHKYNQCDTEKYASDKAVNAARSDKSYQAKWSEMKEKGTGFTSVAVSMEMERNRVMQQTALNIYKKEAKTMSMKYGLDAQDITMHTLMDCQKMRSDLNYKKVYNKEMLGKSSSADLQGYPHLESSQKLQREMQSAAYSKAARKDLTKNSYVKFNEQERAEKMAYDVRGSNYNRQFKEVVSKYKGFQRMDAHQHPIIIEGQRVNDITSHQKYIEDYLMDRNVIYYPVHMTPGYEAACFADKWQSNITYHKDHKANGYKNKFIMSDTERYKDIKNHNNYRSDKKYTAKVMEEFSLGKGLTSIKETPEMIISKALKPLRNDYKKEAQQLATKYGLCHGAMEIARAMEVSEVTNHALYRKQYKTEVMGTTAKNPAIAYPLYDLYKDCQKNRSDINYKKDCKKTLEKYTFVDSDESKRARTAALSCTPREYTKQRAEVIEKYKGFQRMDAATHPIVMEGERVSNLISKSRYLEDYLIDKESIFFPVHLTPGYETAITSSKLCSEKIYSEKYHKDCHKNKFYSTETEKYQSDKQSAAFLSDSSYKAKVNKMFSEGKGFTEITDRFDINLSKSLANTRGEKYSKEAKDICGKYGLAHDALAVTSAIAIGALINKGLYRKKYDLEVKGKGATNPAIAHPEYLHYKDVQSTLNQNNYRAEYEKTHHKYTIAESDEVLRARKVALQCTDKEYNKQRREVINKYKGFQHMDAHLHPVVAEGERVNDIISHHKYIEDYLMERNFIYFPAHITPGYETAVAVNKFASDIPYRKDYLGNRHKNVFNATDTESYQNGKAAKKYTGEKAYKQEWESKGKLQFTSQINNLVTQLALSNTKQNRPNTYQEDAKKIMAKYGLELHNLNLQQSMESGKLHKDNLYKKDYNKNTLGKGATYKGIEDVSDYARAKEVQYNLNDKNYKKTGEEFNHKFTPVYDTPVQLQAVINQKNINHTLYSESKRKAIDKFKGFQRMDAATHPIVVEGLRVDDIISHRKYIEDYLIDRNVIYYPVHLTPGYESAMNAGKWQSSIGYAEAYHKDKFRNQFNLARTEKYIDDKERRAATSETGYKKSWQKKLASGKQHTEITDPTEVKLAAQIKPWIGKAAYTKAAQDIAAKHGLVAGDLSLQHAAETRLKLSMSEYRKVWSESIRGTGGSYKSIDDMYVERQCKLNQAQLSLKNYKAKDQEALHKYTPVFDTPDLRRVKAQAGLLNDKDYMASGRECIAKYKGFQTMDAHSHPVVLRGIEANDRISNARYTEAWNEAKEMIYFPVQITPGYESALRAYQFQSQILYDKDYKRNRKNNVFNMCDTEGYKLKQEADAHRSDHSYQKKYRDTRGRGFTEVMTVTEKNAIDVQPLTSLRLYKAAANSLMGKYHIDCNALQVGHAIEMQKNASEKIYKADYDKDVKGFPSRFFHLTENYDIHKKNAINFNDTLYQKDGRADSHKYTFGPSVGLDHATKVMKLMSTKEYVQSQVEVNKTFKGFAKLTVQDDMSCVRAMENSKNFSKWRYMEDYMEERQYAYFPVHITPGYESGQQQLEFNSDHRYKKNYNENKAKPNFFKVNETEHYQKTQEVTSMLSLHKYQAKYLADRAKGYQGCKGLDMVQETLRDCQQRLSNWKYEAAARKTMGKYDLDMDMPVFKLARENRVKSDTFYRKTGKEQNTHYTSAGKDEFVLEMHGKNKQNMHPKNYTAAHEETKHSYHFTPDNVATKNAREVAKMQSQKEYLKGYEESVKASSAFKNIDFWPQDRFNSEVARNISKHVYQEDYLVDRECCFYPVHITPGYELALEVNKFQSDWLYKQKFQKEIRGKPNKFKQTETDKYKKDNEMKSIQNDFKYQKAGKKQNETWEFTVITPANEHQKAMIDLGSKTKYEKEARLIMMKYDLPVKRIDLVAAQQAKELVSNYIYLTKHRAEKGQSRLWNAAVSVDGPRHKENQQNISEKTYKEASLATSNNYNIPADAYSLKAAKESGSLVSDITYKKSYEEAIKQCRAFTKLSTQDAYEYQHHNYVKDMLSERKYRAEWFEQQGWCIPEFDTPEARRLKENYERGDTSDKIYKRLYRKNILGKGISDFTGPQFQHAKAMKSEQSKLCYEADGKDKHKWASHMANQTPGEVERQAAQDLVSDSNYKDLEYKGLGAAVMTEEVKNQITMQHLASANEYKQKYEDTKHKSLFDKVPDAIDAVGFKEAQKMQSENAYKKLHKKEDIGKPAEMAMSVKLVQDYANQKLASELPYKKKGEETKHIQSYQNNLYLTPWAKYVEEMKNLMSKVRYTQEWDDEKTSVWLPYWWTKEYEHFKAQTKEKSVIKYQESAKIEQSKCNINTTDAPMFEHAREANKLCSQINYGNKKGGVLKPDSMKYTLVADSPTVLRVKEAQLLANNNAYREEADIFNHFYGLDPTGSTYVEGQHHKAVNENMRDVKVMKHDKSYPFKPTNVEIEDDMQMQDQVEKQLQRSDNWYKAEALAEMHAVNGCSVTDTPWHTKAEEAQKYFSGLDYKQDPSKLKRYDEGHDFAKHVKGVQDIISDVKYKDEYENYWKGQVLSLPIPFDLNMESVCDRQKLQDNGAYRKDAKKEMQKYAVVPDTPRFRQLKELCELAGERTYKAAAVDEMRSCNLKDSQSVRNMAVKHAEEVKNDRLYREEAKYEMSLNSQTFNKDIDTQLAATKVADKVLYRKEGKDIMHTNLQEAQTLELEHISKVNQLTDDRAYKQEAQMAMQTVNCNTISCDMDSKQKAQKMTGDIKYKEQAIAEMQVVNMNVADSYTLKTIKDINENVSVANYRNCDQFGGVKDNEWCFQFPDDMALTQAQQTTKYQSDAEYRKQHKDDKGKLAFLAADTPEHARLLKMQEQYSDLRYRDEVKKQMKDITFTPNLKEATKAGEQASELKYRASGKIEMQCNSQQADTITSHQMNISKDTLLSDRNYQELFRQEKDKFTSLPSTEDLKTSNLNRVQKLASKIEYQQKPDINDFTKLDKIYDQERHSDNSFLVSNAYKQKLEGKSLDMVPEIEAKIEFQTMASKLDYVKNSQQNENNFKPETTAMYKQLSKMKGIQSDVQYKREAKEGMDKHRAEGLDNRVDIDHSTNVSKQVSDNEYKKVGKEQRGFTFVPESPLHEHHKHVDNINSDLRYKREGLESQKGKGWQTDESNPFQATFLDAQKFTSGRNYKTSAKEIMRNSCFEDDPTIDRVRNAGRILSEREYRQDFEKKMKGRGYDLHCTPLMASVKNANQIKSDKEYKKHYEENLKGRSAGDLMNTPAMKAAQAAQALMKGDALGDIPDMIAANEKWVNARVTAILDTPEMRRIKEAKKNSHRNYKDDCKAGHIPVDTPEMQRIKNASKIQSKVILLNG